MSVYVHCAIVHILIGIKKGIHEISYDTSIHLIENQQTKRKTRHRCICSAITIDNLIAHRNVNYKTTTTTK